jgi:hypothetical protein
MTETFQILSNSLYDISPKKMSSILGYTLTGDLPGTKNIFAKLKQLGITLTKMYWLLGRKSKPLQATNFSYIKQSSNQSGLTEYNSGVRVPLPT